MTNTYVVCLIALFCCAGLSFGLPNECHQGPSVWCQSLKQAADCGAVGHCTATLWDKRNDVIATNPVSAKFVRFFKQLKDVKDLINADYLMTRVESECEDIKDPAIQSICQQNTRLLFPYIFHVLKSETSAETMCTLIKMCNNPDISMILAKNNLPASAKKLVGASRCTWGPSYWCSNFSTGRECKATHHCVSRVWSKMTFPEDTDSICKICTDMVTQARDQLQSNETQEELKEVFEGSCQLIPIKLVAKECMKLADDFVPELVETLASQMNPQAVCSVAGLCNNAKIDRLLEDFNHQLQLRVECNNCERTVGGLRKKFDRTNDEDFLVGLLQVCRNMDSFSDSCSMLVFKYYENIVAALRQDLTPQSMCHVSGQCAARYHSHDDYTFPGVFTDYRESDDVPCELCEQLVKHLRDVLVANTTELEFYKVLKGLCKQSGNFKDECLHLAEQYYPLIYKYLVQELKANAICSMIGVCGNKTVAPVIAPLVTKEVVVKAITQKPVLVGTDEANSYKTDDLHRVPVNKQTNVRIVSLTEPPPPLPIERMFVSSPQVGGKVACSFCQYFLHYLQVEISDTHTEDEIIDAVNKACDRLPESVNGECKGFVTQYGPGVIALLVQKIDPASVCPALGICPQTEEVRRVEVNKLRSNCPLCLFAVDQLETVLKNNRSEERIREELDNLCTRLSAKLRTECVDFVDTYTDQLIEMLVANMNAQEICVFLKLCKDEVKVPFKIGHGQIDKYHDRPELRGDRNNFRKKSMLPTQMLVKHDQDIETNEIFDNTVNGREVRPPVSQKTVCVVCEFVLKEIDDQIKDKHNEDEIKKVIHNVCTHMPKTIRSECDQFVDKYADMVISLLAQELSPDQVCQELKLCEPSSIGVVKEEILDCAVCETVVAAVRKVLSNDKVDRNIVHIVEKSCGLLPAKYNARCHTMMEIYGDSVIHLIEEFGTKGVCQKIGMCSPSEAAYVHMYREKRV
ncbi:prosaposin [Anticarsia gemmatalis]|uniref:prosaposin n=1 Tax=Anticarsia gemmatalis TaxID=129554 RepID=UPI003F7699B9